MLHGKMTLASSRNRFESDNGLNQGDAELKHNTMQSWAGILDAENVGISTLRRGFVKS